MDAEKFRFAVVAVVQHRIAVCGGEAEYPKGTAVVHNLCFDVVIHVKAASPDMLQVDYKSVDGDVFHVKVARAFRGAFVFLDLHIL